MQLLETVLEVTVFHFRKRLSLRTGIFLLLAFTLLLCSCTGINKTYFFHFKILTDLFSFH